MDISGKKIAYSPKEIERNFGVKAKTVQMWARLRGLKHVKAGRLVLIDAQDWDLRWRRSLAGGGFFDEK